MLGYSQLIIIAMIIIVLTAYSIYLLWQGGIDRVFGRVILVCVFGLILANTIAVLIYAVWEGVSVVPYPWYTYILIKQLPEASQAYQHFIISFVFHMD